MIELYHNDMSVCAQKMRFALAAKKLSWDGHHLNLRAGDQQKPQYLKLNPNAVVPTMVDNSAVIIESTVIHEYLEDAYPKIRLGAADAVGRARMGLWTKQLDEGEVTHGKRRIGVGCFGQSPRSGARRDP